MRTIGSQSHLDCKNCQNSLRHDHQNSAVFAYWKMLSQNNKCFKKSVERPTSNLYQIEYSTNTLAICSHLSKRFFKDINVGLCRDKNGNGSNIDFCFPYSVGDVNFDKYDPSGSRFTNLERYLNKHNNDGVYNRDNN